MKISKKFLAWLSLLLLGTVMYLTYILLPVAGTTAYVYKVQSSTLSGLTVSAKMDGFINGGKVSIRQVVPATPAYITTDGTVTLRGNIVLGKYELTLRQKTDLLAANPSGYFKFTPDFYNTEGLLCYKIRPYTASGGDITYNPALPLYVLNPCPPATPY